MRACCISFVADQFTAHDIGRLLMAAPDDAVVVRIAEHDFGRDCVICLRSERFLEVPSGCIMPRVVATCTRDADGAVTVDVPWPFDPEVAHE